MGGFTERFKRTGKRARDLEVSGFPAKTLCADCAFRQGSPEREDPVRWAEIQKLAHDFRPFYCHVAHDGSVMTTGSDGEYKPMIRKGRPKGFPLCAGWAAMFDKEAREFNARQGKEVG